MRDLNEVTLMGHLGADPRIRTARDGTKFANLTMATSKQGKAEAEGIRKEYTEWHRVVLTGHAAETAERFIRKGSYVLVKGELRTRKYPGSDGIEKSITEIFVTSTNGHKLSLLDGKPKSAPPTEVAPEDAADIPGDVTQH